MTTFNRQIQEDFSGISALADNSSVSGGSTITNILSRYSNLSSDSDAIKNFDQINMGLTDHYATQNSSGQKFAWSLDDITHNSNAARGAFDRYIWSGAIETNSSGNSVFKSANIDSKDTDGFMMIPSPYFPFIPGTNVMADTYNPQDSMRIKLKFDNLPANTFVPLFGFACSTISNPIETTNNNGSLYRSGRHEKIAAERSGNYPYPQYYATIDYDRHYNIPGAIANDSSNLYQRHSTDSSHHNSAPGVYGMWQSDYVKNTVLWFMYAHDGNGKGMVATCAGEGNDSSRSTNDFRPTNEYFGSDNGYLKFKAPKVLDDFLVSNTLSDLWDHYGTGGAGQASLATDDPRREMRQVYHYYREDPLDINHWGTYGQGVWKSLRSNMHALGTGGVYYSSPYRSCANWAPNTLTGWGNYPGDLNYSHFQLISYGETDNSTFSDVSEILINANLISQTRKAIGLYGLSDTNGDNTQSWWNGCHYLYTGKILDFTFRDAPGQMFFDSTPGRGYHRNCSGVWGLSNDISAYSGLGPSALILRPTVTGGGEVHSFSYANYESSGSELIGGGGLNANYYKSIADTDYVFPGEGHSYNALNTPAFDDPNSKWNNTSNLTDGDVSTTSELTESGESNALYVSLNGTTASLSDPEADYDVNPLSIDVRGVNLAGFSSHILHFSITDNSKNKIPFFNDFIQVPQNNTTTPTADGSYSLKFRSSSVNPLSYADIKNGFLKIWSEPVGSKSNIPRSTFFSGDFKDWSTDYDYNGSPSTFPGQTGSNGATAEPDGIKLPDSHQSANTGVISKVFNTTVGTDYLIFWDDVDVTSNFWTRVYADISNSPILDSNNIILGFNKPSNGSIAGPKLTSFKATKSTTEIAFMGMGFQAGGYTKINNIRIEEDTIGVANVTNLSGTISEDGIIIQSAAQWGGGIPPVYVLCDSDYAKVTWIGNHNIQEVTELGWTSNTNNSAEHIGSPIHGFENNGHSQLVGGLGTSVGNTRYFKCTLHPLAKFAITCCSPDPLSTTTDNCPDRSAFP